MTAGASPRAEVVVFAGSTIDARRVTEHVDAAVLPPAAHGDVLRAALGRPRAIGIVDGVFDRLPAVWHKEVLWAIDHGVEVFGAASMGALRACELAPFGMRGIGRIFDAFAAGELEDDDEVAVLHADAADGYRPLSDAMVDIRATLAVALAADVAGTDDVAALLRAAKATHYTNRRLDSLIAQHAPGAEPLRTWCRVNFVEQKRADAIEMCTVIAQWLDAPTVTAPRHWTFQHTQYWETAYRRVVDGDAAAPVRPTGVADSSERDDIGHVMDEARLDPDRYADLEDRALLALLAANDAARAGVDAATDYRRAAIGEVRRAEGLTDDASLTAWLAARALTEADADWLTRRWADRRWIRRSADRQLAGEIVRELKLTGGHDALVDRAAAKRSTMATTGGVAGIDDRELLRWYFADRLARPVPAHHDDWARRHGWRDLPDLLRALRREWHFTQTER